ncbi:MAG: hypothetical protein ACK53A_02835 [Gemmatimonadota bacterium]
MHAWLDGALPPDEAAQVEALVRDDAAWAAAAAEARGLIANASRLVRALDDGAGAAASGDGPVAASPTRPPRLTVVPGQGTRTLRLARRVGAIAAVLLVAVVGRMAWTNQSGTDVAPGATERVMQAKASPPPPAADAVTAKAPEKAPAKAPEKAPAKAPEKAPAKAPAKAPEKAPEKAPAEAVSAASNAASPAVPPGQDAAFASAAAGTVSTRRATAAAAARASLGARASSEASALPLQQEDACVRFAIAWPADGAVPAAAAETQADGRQLRFEGDTARLSQVPMLVRRRDGTTDPAMVRLAVSRRTGTGVTEAVRPDGAVVRRGQVTATMRCP